MTHLEELRERLRAGAPAPEAGELASLVVELLEDHGRRLQDLEAALAQLLEAAAEEQEADPDGLLAFRDKVRARQKGSR